MRLLSIAILVLVSFVSVWAQRNDIVIPKEKKEFAYRSIKELKNGVMIVRLKTNHRKISQLEANVRSPKLNAKQKKRYQAILDGTIQRRDEFNRAIVSMFVDSFSFCPYYLMYDTSSLALKKGVRKGIFVDENFQPDPSIEIKSENIFFINYRKASGEFPFDVLIVRKLHEKLDEPFPYFVELRESWINNVNSPGAERAVARLDRRLHNFYANTLKWEEKQAAKKAKKEAKQANKDTETP